jgi:hypothetical protein
MIEIDVYDDGYVCSVHGRCPRTSPWAAACCHIEADHVGDDIRIVSHSGPLPPPAVRLVIGEMEFTVPEAEARAVPGLLGGPIDDAFTAWAVAHPAADA